MRSIVDRLRREPGRALVLLALVCAALIYAPTLDRGIVSYDDPWLIQSNWLLQNPSWHSLHAVFFDTSFDTRAVLGAEYLPVRDLSIMLDVAIWGDHFGGFHATNLVLYLAAIVLWYQALARLGIERTIAGLAVLFWAVHPSHAESVAWLAERKGLLAMVFAGVVAIAHARYRAGGSGRWLLLAGVAAPLAIWSKALAAFVFVTLAVLELLLPAARVSPSGEASRSWRRALTSIGVIAATAGAAFIPVVITAQRMTVVDTTGGRSLSQSVGTLGFYVRLGAMAMRNAVSYPFSTDGPSTLDILLGTVALVACITALALRSRVAPVLRVAAAWTLIAWFPVSRLVLPVRLVIVADRYALVMTLGFALAAAFAVRRIGKRSVQIALAATLVVAGIARSLDAESSWQDSRTLWARAVESNPHDGNAWSTYSEAVAETGDLDAADNIVERGLANVKSSRLEMHRALMLLRRGDIVEGRNWMRRAAEDGDGKAMANLATLLMQENPAEALSWARKAVAVLPLYANGYRVLGKAALANGRTEEATNAFQRAKTLEPDH